MRIHVLVMCIWNSIYIDGSRNLSSWYYTCGGVFIYHNGDFIRIFQYHIGIESSLFVETCVFMNSHVFMIEESSKFEYWEWLL